MADDDEEAEIYYVPRIPKIAIPPISFHTPTVPSKPVSPGKTTPPEAPIYTPEHKRDLRLMISYATELAGLIQRAADLGLGIEGIAEITGLAVEKSLGLKIYPAVFSSSGYFVPADNRISVENIIELKTPLSVVKDLRLKALPGMESELPPVSHLESTLGVGTGITYHVYLSRIPCNLGLKTEYRAGLAVSKGTKYDGYSKGDVLAMAGYKYDGYSKGDVLAMAGYMGNGYYKSSVAV